MRKIDETYNLRARENIYNRFMKSIHKWHIVYVFMCIHVVWSLLCIIQSVSFLNLLPVFRHFVFMYPFLHHCIFVWTFVFPLRFFLWFWTDTMLSVFQRTSNLRHYGKYQAYISHFMWSNAKPLDIVFNQNVFLALKSYSFGLHTPTTYFLNNIVISNRSCSLCTPTKRERKKFSKFLV